MARSPVLDDADLAALEAAVLRARQASFDAMSATVGLTGAEAVEAGAHAEIARARFREMKELLDELREKAIRSAGGDEETLTADVDAAVGERAKLTAKVRLERWRLQRCVDEVADAERIIASFTTSIDAAIGAVGPFDSGRLDEAIGRARQLIDRSADVTASITERIRELEAALRNRGGR
jgi:hypothetical protein